MEPQAINDWRRTDYIGSLGKEQDQKEVTLAGWVQDIRNLGGIAFLVLRDRTGTMQVTLLKKKLEDMYKPLTELPRESVVMVKGRVQLNDKVHTGIEVMPSEVKLLSKAATPLPLGIVDEVNAELDTRLNARFLDLRKDDVRAVFMLRNSILDATRAQLNEEGFIEIQTPKIVGAATEGGTSLFPMEYFDRKAYLNQSPQLFKQMLMATGFDKVCEIGPAFRAEEHDTVRHLNEFTSIDIEMAFSDEEDVMGVLERLIKASVDLIKSSNQKELETLGIELEDVPLPLPRLTYDECREICKEKGLDIPFGEDLTMEATKLLAEKVQGYYFITRWPMAAKPFYIQPYEPDPKYSRGFDLMYKEKEITSGGQRVHDLAFLISRLEEQGLDPEDFTFYLDAFKYGIPPHAGWGLGLERMAMILSQSDNIRECVLFPRDRYRLIP